MELLYCSYIVGVLCLVGVHSQIPENSAQSGTEDRPIIQTKDGAVRGKRAKTVDGQTTYYAFQGIPYAEVPIGERRFKAPEKKLKWSGVLNTTEDKSECLQFGNPPQGSEDCLYINVYTPSLKGKKLPVMAWIYGGGFNLGNSSYRMYGPDYLLEKEVVFVSFNYRLGIFGFGSTEDSVSPGNYGLKDQILALKWVQDNIALFGGDPRKVTITGQSAGSASVSYLLQMNSTRELFRAAILESGSSLSLWALNRKSRQTMFAVGQVLNIDTSSSASLINGLRKVNSSTLQNVAFVLSTNATIDNILEGLVFGPVKEPGIVERYSELELSQGRYPRKPVIIGFTSNEAASGGEFPAIVCQYVERYDRNITRLVPIDLTRNNAKMQQAASQIKSFYFGTSPIAGQLDAIIKFVGDDLFYRPIRRDVLDQSKFAPVYFYQFSYTGVLGGITNRSQEGPGHAEELDYLFRRSVNFTVPTSDVLTRSRMVKLWTNFVKFLNPTPTKDSLFENITWLPSTTNNQLYLDIDTYLGLQLNPFNNRMKFWDDIYRQFGDPPYDTY